MHIGVRCTWMSRCHLEDGRHHCPLFHVIGWWDPIKYLEVVQSGLALPRLGGTMSHTVSQKMQLRVRIWEGLVFICLQRKARYFRVLLWKLSALLMPSQCRTTAFPSRSTRLAMTAARWPSRWPWPSSPRTCLSIIFSSRLGKLFSNF